ncbi:sigma 54-interacting transcriptional regulator [Tautonia plasticadhaerens]|uniref:Transcriptional regulatory protein ZraR n=1 Tax=Tautonia plasticadhaerens TaxID=2527974 RepID=A0A518H0G7_9BACT|nr:sigma 54-interacting transcriptional regulator [Tautonia plasticadhaerens]QDV34334.1 Transcriptional regulatory protein ZraR [Tautonia plasticadhaerens]
MTDESGPDRPGRRPPLPDLSHRSAVIVATLGVLVYSAAVLWVVATSGDVGIRCVFGTAQKEQIGQEEYDWYDAERGPGAHLAPGIGDQLTRIASADGSWSFDIEQGDYTAVIRAQRRIGESARGREVRVDWIPAGGPIDGEPVRAVAKVRSRPIATYVWSFVWLALELVLFGIGGIVSWRRPNDRAARVFFWLCVVTVGAYMGGYHWSEIVINRPLIFGFVPMAMAVPIVSLHFYLVFPRPSPLMLLHRRRVLAWLYGVPVACVAILWAAMVWLSFSGEAGGVSGPPGAAVVGRRLMAQGIIKWVALGYVAYSVAIFALCIACLIYSDRRARNRAERNQVRWILLASLVSTVLIGYLMLMTWEDTAVLGLDSAAWPMYVVSLLYTSAYAVSITRYKLMQAEEIFHRSVRYLLVSLGLSLLYSLVLVVGAVAVGYSLQDDQTSREATVVMITALVILVLSGAVRRRFEQAIDRRFFREKSKFDQAMRKMSQAVDRLVDRRTLGRRLLEAAAEVLGLDWGAIYLREAPGRPLTAVASLGPEPEQATLPDDGPIVRRLRSRPTLRLPGTMGRAPVDPIADALIALGGEVAAALSSDGELAGVLILGPKRNGMPYDDEELVFLAALASVAVLALHSASIHRTLEELNRELRDKVEKIAEQQRRILILQDQLMGGHGAASGVDRPPAPVGPPAPEPDPEALERIRGTSPAIRRVLETVRKAAASPSAVLILGESGTGKELIAEAIHAASPRSGGPFIKVHCASLAPGLLESELFGHVKGAFTGADRDRVGRFQQAHGGTLLLDEIGDVGLDVQTKLLRVLQTKTFERVGSSQPITVDVRIVAATHRDLPAMIRSGRFREDLYYRLNVISIVSPPLRVRRDDVFELAVTFLRRFAERSGKPITLLEDDAIEALTAYDWPGNVRELENVIERAVVLAEGPSITRDDLPPDLFGPSSAYRLRRRAAAAAPGGRRGRPRRLASPAGWDAPGPDPADPELDAFERHQLRDALAEARGNKSEAARLLGLPRSTLVSKLKKHDLMDPDGG